MKNTLLSLICLAIVFTSCGQKNCNINRAYAFFQVIQPGMIPVDENGRRREMPPNIERFIYIECVGTKMPSIEKLIYNNIVFYPQLTRLYGNEIIAGKKFENAEDFKLVAKNGNSFWKIELIQVGENPVVKPDCRNIIIKTKAAGKYCKFYLFKENELMPLPRY